MIKKLSLTKIAAVFMIAIASLIFDNMQNKPIMLNPQIANKQ
jgi:hypothetical protein